MATETTAGPLLGWPLLPLPGAGGELAWPGLEESIRQQVRVILLTRPGEQLMRPEYGAGLAEFLHQPNSLETRRAVRDRVAESLARWEPRIAVDRVEVWEVDGRPTQLRLDISYRVVRTGAAQQLGLVMELGG